MWLPQCGQTQCVCVCVYARLTQRDAIPSDPLNPQDLSSFHALIFLLFSSFLTPSSPPLTARERREQLFDLSPPLSALAMKKGTSIRSSPLWSSPDRWDQRGFSPFFSVFFLTFWWVCVVLRWHAGRGNDFESRAAWPCQGLNTSHINTQSQI